MAGVNGIEIKVGQVWRCQDGKERSVTRYDNEGEQYPWLAGGHWYNNAGVGDFRGVEMIELVKDAPPQPTDSATLAEETLSALGWTFDGQAWVENAVVTMAPNALDVQVGGSHYKDMGVQPWAAFDSWLSPEQHVGYLLGTAIAYLARFNSKGVGKGGLVDVEKATHTLQRLVEVAKKGSANED